MLYPMAGQPVLDRYTLPRFDTPEDLARTKGMKDGALAYLPGALGGVLVYLAALRAGRTVYQDDFSTFDGWILDETSGTWAKSGALPASGEMAPASHIYGVTSGWYGPLATKDLGQNVDDGVFAVNLSWLNNSVGAIARVGIALFDAAMAPIGAVDLADLQVATSQSLVRWYGPGFSLTSTGFSVGTSIISLVNPNSGDAWFGLKKSGTTLTAFGPTGEQASYVVAGAGAVRYVVLYAQANRINPTNYSYFGIGAIKGFRAIVSPVNAATASKAFASSTNPTYPVANAFDGSISTEWGSNVAGAGNAMVSYLAQDLGVGNKQALQAVEIVNHPSGSIGTRATSIYIGVADDPAGPWTDYGPFIGITANSGLTRCELPVGLSARRCQRILCGGGVISSGWFIAEARFFYAPAPPNETLEVLSHFADGTWLMDLPAQGFNPLPSYLGW